jgi:hypothetical protein
MLESFGDLCAVVKDPKYPERMLATFYAAKVRHLSNMIAFPHNVYHADLTKNARFDPSAELQQVKAELRAITDRQQLPLSNKDRLIAGGLQEEHQSLYWQLSLDSHYSIQALEERHIEQEGDGSFGIVLCKENSKADLARYYDAIIGVLLDAGIKVHRFMGTPVVSRFEQLHEKLRVFRESLASG